MQTSLFIYYTQIATPSITRTPVKYYHPERTSYAATNDADASTASPSGGPTGLREGSRSQTYRFFAALRMTR